jgi:RNA polymerase sigma-70 factor (ECF subfamily)
LFIGLLPETQADSAYPLVHRQQESQIPQVRAARHIPTTARIRTGHMAVMRPAVTITPENEHSSLPPVLHCLPLTRGRLVEFHPFDEAYVAQLRAGDFRTQEHFRVYFTALIQVKLRSRLRSREAIEDVQQETFARFYVALREGKIAQPERLGPFVNSMCNNVLLEHYRAAARHDSMDEEQQRDLPDNAIDLISLLTAKETEKKVREVLDQLPELDRRLLREVFLEERDKDEVCRDFGVNRDYLRVLVHRAKKLFKALYLRNNRSDLPEFNVV